MTTNEVVLLIVGISAGVAAIAFAILVGYLVSLIQAAKRSLTDANETLARIRKELESVSQQSVNLMAAGEQLVRETDEKLRALDPITRSVKQTGEALEQVSASVKQVSSAVSRQASGIGQTVERNPGKFSDVLEFATLGLQLLQKWQSRRNAKNHDQKAGTED